MKFLLRREKKKIKKKGSIVFFHGLKNLSGLEFVLKSILGVKNKKTKIGPKNPHFFTRLLDSLGHAA